MKFNVKPTANTVAPQRTIREITDLHKKGVITDSEFNTLMRVYASEQIEEQVEDQLQNALDALHMSFVELLSGRSRKYGK